MDEVTLKDLTDGTGKSKKGYEKIQFYGEQAKRDGLEHFWVDSWCIDKSSSAELSEAINSIFVCYGDAAKCYIYLADVPGLAIDAKDTSEQPPPWESAFRQSRWFTRGWTLQELIAPASPEFFSKDWVYPGNRTTLARLVREITGIPIRDLEHRPLTSPSF